MGIVLDRRALHEAIRRTPQFRSLTTRLQRGLEREAVTVADSRVERRTGEYVEGFDTTVMPVSSPTIIARLALTNKAKHAPFLEGGTRPHIIRVRRARVLFNSDTQTVYGTKVQHPGTRPYNIIRESVLRFSRRHHS